MVFCVLAALAELALAGVCSFFTGRAGTGLLFASAAVFSTLYSAPPVRMKLRGWAANLTVAIPRGVLLKVAGWSLTASMFSVEAWYIGLIMGFFLLGATTTKDFSDITGDAAYGV